MSQVQKCFKRFKSTHFGFKTILEDQKEQFVGQVFSNVARNYDIMNDVMSVGIHRIWKDNFVSKISPCPSSKLLDVAGGSGDIAFRLLDHVKHHYGANSTVECTVLDINNDMLDVGRSRAAEKGYSNEKQLKFIQGNAESLESIESNSMDSYTISFGIRNCTHIDKVLKEAYRVLKKGGRFSCLEFSHIPNPIMQSAYDQYSFNLIPLFGQIIANDRDSYQYLVESIRKFPKQQEFKSMINNAGFKTIGKGWEDLSFGIVAIHTGWKL